MWKRLTEAEFNQSLDLGAKNYMKSSGENFRVGLLVGLLVAFTASFASQFSTRLNSLLPVAGTIWVVGIFVTVFLLFATLSAILGFVDQARFKRMDVEARRRMILQQRTRVAGWICSSCNSYSRNATSRCPRCGGITVSSVHYQWVEPEGPRGT